MTEYVLDSSALLAAFFGEPGSERVEQILPQSVISTVNLSEVVAKLQDRDVPDDEIEQIIAGLDLAVVDFDRRQALGAGRLRRSTRRSGVSLGDRACLALAAERGATAVTADRAWLALEIGISVEAVR